MDRCVAISVLLETQESVYLLHLMYRIAIAQAVTPLLLAAASDIGIFWRVVTPIQAHLLRWNLSPYCGVELCIGLGESDKLRGRPTVTVTKQI